MNRLEIDLAELSLRIKEEILEFESNHDVEVTYITLNRVDTTTHGNGISSSLKEVICEATVKGSTNYTS